MPKRDKPSPDDPSRRDKLLKEGIEDPEMPHIDAPHLLDYLFEVGPVLASGTGPTPLTHAELDAWQRNTGIELTAWEARTLRSLSAAYLTQHHHATKPDCPAPWQDAPYARPAASLVAQGMKNALRGLKNL